MVPLHRVRRAGPSQLTPPPASEGPGPETRLLWGEPVKFRKRVAQRQVAGGRQSREAPRQRVVRKPLAGALLQRVEAVQAALPQREAHVLPAVRRRLELRPPAENQQSVVPTLVECIREAPKQSGAAL